MLPRNAMFLNHVMNTQFIISIRFFPHQCYLFYCLKSFSFAFYFALFIFFSFLSQEETECPITIASGTSIVLLDMYYSLARRFIFAYQCHTEVDYFKYFPPENKFGFSSDEMTNCEKWK